MNIQTNTFDELNISGKILEVLKKQHITVPTPIQHQAVPIGLEGKDLMGIAQTGTGKTLAFGIPLIQRLDHLNGRGLILLPTRELAQQVNETIARLGKPFNIKTVVLIGGESMGRQIHELAQKPRVIIATPGRLIDHLERKRVTLSDIKILVLDEADRMFDMGFAPQINRIVKVVPKERQTLLFSATMPPTVVNLATHHMSLPIRIEVAPAGTAAADIEQEIMLVKPEAKLAMLERLVEDNKGTALVFSRTRHGAKKITSVLRTMGHTVSEIHANRSQSQRREALAGFKSGRYRILVATDIASRGIDVSGIEIVINFDLPDQAEDYVHRIGRTGRAGQKGKAVSLATPDQRQKIRLIEKLIRKSLPVHNPEGLAETAPIDDGRSRQRRPHPKGPGKGKRFHSHKPGNRDHRGKAASSKDHRPQRTEEGGSKPHRGKGKVRRGAIGWENLGGGGKRRF